MSAVLWADELVPEHLPLAVGRRRELPYAIRAVSRPASEFTGDFFASFEVEGALWFAVGDFAGHGLSAVVFMAMIQEVLETTVRSCSAGDPAEVVASLDRDLREIFPSNRFATLVVGRASRDGEILVANAGHCPPVIVRSDGTIESIGSHGPVVGLSPLPGWTQQVVHLGRGERLFLYSDGLLEASDVNGDEFGETCLFGRLQNFHPAQPLESILDAVEAHANGRRNDDMTIFLLQRS